MAWMHPDWEDVECGQISSLCGNPDTGHGGDDWPRVVILHLSAEEFELFDANPLEYARDNNLFPISRSCGWPIVPSRLSA